MAPFLEAAPFNIAAEYGVNIRDYSTDGEDRNWGRGWPECSGPRGYVVTVVAPISDARFPVHARVARLWSWVVDRAELVHGYIMDPSQCGAYNCRPIGGTSVPSNHSWALAGDVDWRKNPYVKPRVSVLPPAMIADAKAVGFAWGGDYGNGGTTGKADSMHFEFMGTPQQADTITEILFAPREDEDDMAGAFPVDLPAATTDDAGKPVEYKAGEFGHLEVIPLPLNTGGGAAKDGATVWVSLYCGHGDVQVKQFEFKCDNPANNKNHGPFVLKGGVRKWFEAPDSAHDAEIRYTAPLAFGAIVEWRKL